MKGTVLSFDKFNNTGQISGNDGNRYKFTKMNWNSQIIPNSGIEVDFEISEGQAIEIIALNNFSNGAKSRSTYIILAIFFGSLGIHNFYAGYKNKAITQLIITLVSIPLIFLIIGIFTIWIPGIWALIEAVTVTQDFDGNRFN